MNDYRTNWMLPALPLGPAIRRDGFDTSEALARWYELRHFEQVDHDFNPSEQIEGAAPREPDKAQQCAGTKPESAAPPMQGVWRKPHGQSFSVGTLFRVLHDDSWIGTFIEQCGADSLFPGQYRVDTAMHGICICSNEECEWFDTEAT